MWEALTAIGSIASAVVIAVTVVMAARQIRLTVDQLEQVRRATQFDAARTVLHDLADHEFTNAYRFVIMELEGRMHDDAFLREVALIGLADDAVHKEIVMLRSLDRIGTYVRFGLVDGQIIYTSYLPRILVAWEALRSVVAIHREVAEQPIWENAQHLYEDGKRWAAANGREWNVNAMLRRAGVTSGSASM